MTNENLINLPGYGDFDADADRRVDLSAGGLDIDLSALSGVLRVSGGVAYANAKHSDLGNISANEHKDHSGISISSGTGLTGGGNITTTRTLSLDINGLVADASPDETADYVMTYDVDAGTHKKVLLNNLPGAAGVNTFLELTDTPSSYDSADIGKFLRVKSDLSALEFVAVSEGHSFVGRNPTAHDYSQFHYAGTITGQNDFHVIDSAATFISDGMIVGGWVKNHTHTTWAQVTAINSETDLTLDANIFPDDDGDACHATIFRFDSTEQALDLSGKIDEGAVLVLLKVDMESSGTTDLIDFYKPGTDRTYNGDQMNCRVADKRFYKQMLIECDSNREINYFTGFSGSLHVNVIGWWK